MMASRRWPSPTAPSIQCPSPSGPRWAMASVMRCSSGGAIGSPSRLTTPAMPHTAVACSGDVPQAGDYVVVVLGAHAVVQWNRHALLGAVARRGEVLRLQPKPLLVIAEHVHGVRAGTRGH